MDNLDSHFSGIYTKLLKEKEELIKRAFYQKTGEELSVSNSHLVYVQITNFGKRVEIYRLTATDEPFIIIYECMVAYQFTAGSNKMDVQFDYAIL